MAERSNHWEDLEAKARASRRAEREKTREKVEEWDGWSFRGTDSKGRWMAEGPGRKRITADTGAELVRKVRAECDEDAEQPVQGDLFAAPACVEVTDADLVHEDAPSVRVVGTHRQLGVEVRLGLASGGRS